jgi:pyrroline-5-carboxylate reductase
MARKNNILLVGCGKMGSALLQGWLDAKISAHFSVVEPSHHLEHKNVHHYKDIPKAIDAVKKSDVLILAVKPQTMNEVCEQLKPLLQPHTLLLSIAAGRSLAGFASFFGAKQPMIRAMPNTPAAIGKGISVAVANNHVTDAQRALAGKLLKCSGACEWVEDEKLLDAVTALSGSGPAYVFYLIEMMATAGKKIGLSEALAMKLARQTVIGSAALAEAEAQTTADTLRHNVTSPQGTTEAALKVLMDGRAQHIFDDALAAAKKRSKDLSS